VRVIVASTGQQLGVMKIQDALRIAQQHGLDLVEVSANAIPPVCRIVDFGKFKYELAKHDKEKKQNAASKMKEIKFRVNIDKHDYETKLRHAEEFLDKGNKVRILLQFRGREMAHKEIGIALMKKIEADLTSMGNPESAPKMMGKNVIMNVVPLPPGKRKRQFFSEHQLSVADDVESDEDDDEDEESEDKD
jgi:translation initiation factor IF-3